MNLNQEQLRALAESCHIGLTGEECEALVGELNELLALADRLPVAEGVCDPEATAVSPEQRCPVSPARLRFRTAAGPARAALRFRAPWRASHDGGT